MNAIETKNILSVIESVYPTFKIRDLESTIKAWEWAFSDFTYEQVGSALKNYIRTSGTNFAPSASQLIGLINVVEEHTYPTEEEAWYLVQKAFRNIRWDTPEIEYDKLPEIIQKALVVPAALVEMGKYEGDAGVQESLFKKNYRSVVERDKSEKKLPEEVRAKIDMARHGGQYKIEG